MKIIKAQLFASGATLCERKREYTSKPSRILPSLPVSQLAMMRAGCGLAKQQSRFHIQRRLNTDQPGAQVLHQHEHQRQSSLSYVHVAKNNGGITGVVLALMH